jgi:hypothetical protein
MAGITANRHKNINANKYPHCFADRKFVRRGETQSGWRAIPCSRSAALRLATFWFSVLGMAKLLKFFSRQHLHHPYHNNGESHISKSPAFPPRASYKLRVCTSLLAIFDQKNYKDPSKTMAGIKRRDLYTHLITNLAT